MKTALLMAAFLKICSAADYQVPMTDGNGDPGKYYYIISLSGENIEVYIAQNEDGKFVRIPQTGLLQDGKYSIVCDLQKGNAIGLANLKGSVTVNDEKIPFLNGIKAEMVVSGFPPKK